MCIPAALGALGSALGIGGASAGAAAAGGAAAGAATFGSTLQTIGTLASVGGTIAQGFAARNAAKAQVAEIERQKRDVARLNAIEEGRSRGKFEQAMAQQRAELAARGVSLDSPTAVYLGQSAAREMTFEAQSIRQTGYAQRSELTAAQRTADAEGRLGMLRGGFSAAGSLLNSAPDLWPELLA